MNLFELYNKEDESPSLMSAFQDFLPMVMDYLEIDSLPRIQLEKEIKSDRPTFGCYVDEENTIYIAITNRHPTDILRTLAHELVHYKQDTKDEIEHDSGDTGSDEENEANAEAGIIMRNFNEKYPKYLNSTPIVD